MTIPTWFLIVVCIFVIMKIVETFMNILLIAHEFDDDVQEQHVVQSEDVLLVPKISSSQLDPRIARNQFIATRTRQEQERNSKKK